MNHSLALLGSVLSLVLAAQQKQCHPPPATPPSTTPTTPATTPGVYGGVCTTAFPAAAATGKWEKWENQYLVAKTPPVLHRGLDVVANETDDVTLRAKFTYGPTDKDLEGEYVEVWVRRCPGWERLDTLKTDDEGEARHDVAAGTFPPGDYRVRWVVRADGSFAEGTLAVWRTGMKTVVTDIDGTLTTDDTQVFTDVLGGGTAAMYPDADKVMQEYAAKGYRIVYLTGRPAALERYTRDWLAKKGFPWGVVRVTSDALSIVPTDFGVQAFKTEFLKDLAQQSGVSFVEAYGNATTDIGAYDAAAIAKSHTWIIGTNAGKDGTQPVSDYASHLPYVQGLARAIQP